MGDVLNILVVDDEPSIVELLSEYLRARGHRVWSASDGEGALELLGKRDLDLVLTDMKMPGLNGLELLERLKGREPYIGAILMTGYGTIDSAIRAMKNGAQDYLIKPFKLREVHTAVIRAAERTRLERETVRLRQVVALFENAHTLQDPSGLDELYAHLATVADQELDARGALVAFNEPSVGRWVESCRTARAPFSGLDLQALGLALASGVSRGAPIDGAWIGTGQPLVVAPIHAQLQPGEGASLVGLVAVVGAQSPEENAGRTSLKIAGSLVGDALTRQVLGDRTRAYGRRWGEALPERNTRGERLEALMARVDTLLDPGDRTLACRAARLHGELEFTTRGLLRGQLPKAPDRTPAEDRKLREILLGASERFDGGGSPRGQGGEGISKTSRLLAIIDCWDWLTLARGFAPRLSPIDARAALYAEAGARLDPLLVEPFLELV